MSVTILACGCERREVARPWLSRPHVTHRCRQCVTEAAEVCWDGHTRTHDLTPATATAQAARSAPAPQRPAPATPASSAYVDAFAHAIARMPAASTKPPSARFVPFADRYPDAARRGRHLGAQHRVRFPSDPYSLAASLGYSVRLVVNTALPAFPGGRHAQGILVPSDRRILVDVALGQDDRDKVVAHECGHILTGYQRRPMSQLVTSGWDDPDEVAAESFAFAFLNIQS